MDKIVKNFYLKFNEDIKSYNISYYKNKISKITNDIEFSDFNSLYRLSLIFKDFVKNTNITDIFNVKCIKNLVKLYTKEDYLLSMIEPSFLSAIRFKKMLTLHNIYNPLLIKEFIISFYCIILYMPLGCITNLKLFESIQILWMIVDNIIDNKEMNCQKKLLKPLFKFLNNEIYEKDNYKEFLYKYKNNICIQIVNDIYRNQKLIDKKLFFRDVKKLLQYSYSKNGIKVETDAKNIDILTVSLNKSYLSHKLFKHCLSSETNIKEETFYYLCLISQLSDDLLDLSEDLINNGNTIFTAETRKNRSIITLSLLDIIRDKFPSIEKYLIISVVDAVLYNKHLHDPQFIKELLNYNFIDVKKCDLQEIEEYIFNDTKLDLLLDEKLIDVYKQDVETLDLNDIVVGLENNIKLI